ncbi:MAG: DNA polymerase III subunit delta [Ruminococcaceae bacterium]|nr:DNA polymerase III subunit delta [Oscillospiraceae bacterium]
MAKKATGTSAGGEQLKNDLKNKTLGRFYIIFGEEDYLRRYYHEQVKKQLLDDLTADFNYHRLTSENFSLQLLFDSLEALPMMADRSLVEIDEVDLFALNEEETQQLSELLSDLPDYCCLVMVYNDFKPDKRKKLWKTLEKTAVLAEYKYQSETELRPWIVRHFKDHGKSISADLCNYLIGLTGSSMTRLLMEIEKICSYSGAEMIVREDVDAVVEPTLEAIVFELTDAMAERRFDLAIERLHVMFKMQTEPIPIVAAIGGQMRRLRAAKILKNADELAGVCSLQSYAAGKTMTQARRFSERFCNRAVLLCCDTDYKLKTSYDEGQRLVEMLILQLAQEASND